jgi:hypothetical protein
VLINFEDPFPHHVVALGEQRGAFCYGSMGKPYGRQSRDFREDEEQKTWPAIYKEAGTKIDAETADVLKCGRNYFASSPGSDVWVFFRRFARGDPRRLVEKARPQ